MDKTDPQVAHLPTIARIKSLRTQGHEVEPTTAWIEPLMFERWSNDLLGAARIRTKAEAYMLASPAIREAAQRFLNHITPRYPMRDGRPLAATSFVNAIMAYHEAASKGRSRTEAQIEFFMVMLDAAEEMLWHQVVALTHHAELVVWPYGPEPLADWLKRIEAQHVYVERVQVRTREELVGAREMVSWTVLSLRDVGRIAMANQPTWRASHFSQASGEG